MRCKLMIFVARDESQPLRRDGVLERARAVPYQLTERGRDGCRPVAWFCVWKGWRQVQVPGFLLRRLYVKGSLRNGNDRFAFELKNSLGSGYTEQVLPLTVDGDEIRADQATFMVDGASVRFSEVSSERPFTLAMNTVVTVEVAGRTLEPGKHKIGIGFVVTGMGKMQFDVTDAIEPSADAAGRGRDDGVVG